MSFFSSSAVKQSTSPVSGTRTGPPAPLLMLLFSASLVAALVVALTSRWDLASLWRFIAALTCSAARAFVLVLKDANFSGVKLQSLYWVEVRYSSSSVMLGGCISEK